MRLSFVLIIKRVQNAQLSGKMNFQVIAAIRLIREVYFISCAWSAKNTHKHKTNTTKEKENEREINREKQTVKQTVTHRNLMPQAL